MALSLSDLLRRMLEMSGSDLHITTNSPPQIRVHGHLVPLDLPQLTPAETKQLAYSVMTIRRSTASKKTSSSTSLLD